MPETLERLVARLNATAYIPNTEPTAHAATAQPRRSKMAKQVKLAKGKEFTFTSGGAQATKYPWSEWFGGSLLLLERSEMQKGADGKEVKDEDGNTTVVEKKDFDVEVDAMPAKIKTAARRRYKIVQISKRDADGQKIPNGIIIKARDMTPEEKVAEDQLRAEERAARKDKAAPADDGDTAPNGDEAAS